MNGFLYALAMFMFVVSLLSCVLGWLRPSLFKFLGSHATRWRIASYSLGLILISTIISSSFEPASIKRARSDRENRVDTSEEQKTANELKEEEAVEYNQIAPTPNVETGNKVPAPQPPVAQTNPENSADNPSFSANPHGILDFRREVVKKSRSDKICYTPGATKYHRIINYKTYKTLGECLNSGGRRPAE